MHTLLDETSASMAQDQAGIAEQKSHITKHAFRPSEKSQSVSRGSKNGLA
jgi:hypothetical protein